MHFRTLLSRLLASVTLFHATIALPSPSSESNIQSFPTKNAAGVDITKAIPFPFNPTHPEPLVNIFDAILHIPDEVLDKQDNGISLHEWILEHGGAGLTLDLSAGQGLVERQTWFDIAKCAWEIGKMILDNAVPLAKIRRIKDLIAAIGSASKVAKMMLKARSWAELKAVGGAPMAKLIPELVGLRSVVDACFSF